MGIELAILNAIQTIHAPVLDDFMLCVSALGDGWHIWLILMVALLLRSKTRRCGIIMAVSLLICFVLGNLILKELVARTRPFDVNTAVELLLPGPGDYSFPSGHTSGSFAAVMVLYLTSAGREAWQRLLPLLPQVNRTGRLWLPALVVAVLIAFSRMYLYMHYPTDILGGILVGVFSGLAGYWLVARIRQSRTER